MKSVKLIVAAALCFGSVSAWATPSTQIWIPSTDIQKYNTFHLNYDIYLPVKQEPNGTWKAPFSMIGPTMGVFNSEKVQAEAGFDIMKAGMGLSPNRVYDNNPFYLHAKAATQEGSLFSGSPALALGGYNFGTKKDVTNQNIVYGLAARNIGKLGRLSAGYYSGNDKVLLDENGKKANTGVLLSWDRTITEVSDKLWAAVDYQGGESALGALNFGVSWNFASNTSVIFGYDIYNNSKVAGADTVTIQLDINI